MNRQQRRMSQKIGRSMMKLPDNNFEDITTEARLKTQFDLSKYPDRIWKNNHYVVQLYKKERVLFNTLMDKIMIRRNDSEKITEWHTLQDIKNRICGDNETAIQVFPPKDQLVDAANLYWLFIPSGRFGNE